MAFSFESLTVYQKSLDMIDQVEVLSKNLRGQVSFSFLDQLSRASTSVALNIAEGNGCWYTNDKKQFFRIAQGSVFEMVPIIQIMRRRNFIEQHCYSSLYALLEELAKMLTNLIKSIENLKRG